MADRAPRQGNPQITAAVSAQALAGSFPGDLGIEVVEIGDDHAVGRLLVDRRHLHPGGYVHGGVWVAFADTIAAWGTMRSLSPEHNFTTVELKTNVFLSARSGDELVGRGEPLHRGSRTQVWEVRIYKAGDPARPAGDPAGLAAGDPGRLAANFVCTQMVLPGPRRAATQPGAASIGDGPAPAQGS